MPFRHPGKVKNSMFYLCFLYIPLQRFTSNWFSRLRFPPVKLFDHLACSLHVFLTPDVVRSKVDRVRCPVISMILLPSMAASDALRTKV
jgi:hypothetical protein